MKTAEEFLKYFNEKEGNVDKLYYDSYVKKTNERICKNTCTRSFKTS